MYQTLDECLIDLENNGELLRIKSAIDPNLEMAEVHRRIYDAKGPAILFENVKGSPFRAASNIYGTFERTNFIFRKTLPNLKKIIELKTDFSRLLKSPLNYLSTIPTALHALPVKSRWHKPILYGETSIDKLPQIIAWKDDGGAFITLPQVLTLPPNTDNIMQSNLGMYRVQLSGNDYLPNKEIGMHYQLHRGIGVHHTAYNQSNLPFKVSIFVGGGPSHAFSAIMPLPEDMSELTFAGMLGGRRFRYFKKDGHILSSDADFVITGTLEKGIKKPEGPFGDHLGYYSLRHDFPVMKVDKVYHRKNPIWQFTVVGRPPQEDSSFGYLISELVSGLAAQEFPGVKDLNAVDAAGVHPLLLVVGSERYMPFREKRPEEILIQANRILGSGQTSLSKYLWIADGSNNSSLSSHNIPAFFDYVLRRIDWSRDLHFQTQTTIDTLDYSGDGWNAGSKLIIACSGNEIRNLSANLPSDFKLPIGFSNPIFYQKGILCIQANKWESSIDAKEEVQLLTKHLSTINMKEIPWIVLCDDSTFTALNTNNFVWVTFTRSNPSHDVHGVDSFIRNKHWGCKSTMIIDARIKSHHAPELKPDAKTTAKVDRLFSKGGELYGVLPIQK